MRFVAGADYTVENVLGLHAMCLDRGTVHHEFMHTLGFRHEHQRFDRDLHINFNPDSLADRCEPWRYEEWEHNDFRFFFESRTKV